MLRTLMISRSLLQGPWLMLSREKNTLSGGRLSNTPNTENNCRFPVTKEQNQLVRDWSNISLAAISKGLVSKLPKRLWNSMEKILSMKSWSILKNLKLSQGCLLKVVRPLYLHSVSTTVQKWSWPSLPTMEFLIN